MMKYEIRCIIVEDEPLAADQMREFIGRINYLKLCGSFGNAFDALAFLKTNVTDLIFLDVEMEDLSGIQLLESLDKIPFVILTTAYDKYALKGYELQVFDYLLKPISKTRFIQSVGRVFDIMFGQDKKIRDAIQMNENTKEFIFVKVNHTLQKINTDEILYIRGMSNYVIIKTKNKSISTHTGLQKIIDALPYENFCRVHKSFIVAVNKIDKINRLFVTINDTNIPIGESYRQHFMLFLGKQDLI